MGIFDFLNKDEKQEKINSKVNNILNPFVKKDGSLVNPYLNYQKLIDSDKISNTAKKFMQSATGLSPTIKPIVEENDEGLELAKAVRQRVVQENQIENTHDFSQHSNEKLGFVSAKYEVGGYNPARISTGNGDHGGVSYGIPQFSTKTGSADKFVNYLKQAKPEIGKYFGNAKAGTKEFNNAWQKVSSNYGDTFGNMQTQYAYDCYVKPLANSALRKTGIDYTRSPALKELLYSTAIQFGGGNLGLSALGNANKNMSDKDIVNASYDKKISNYKSYFVSSSKSVQESVKNRFLHERNDVLGLLK